MDMVTRAYEAQVDSVLEGERSVVARINTGCVDEYRTVIDPRGADLKDFNTNPPVLWMHGKEARGSLPIGRGWVKARSSENDLIGKCIFAKDDFSQQLFEMYRDGTLRGWSINMIPSEASPPTKEEMRARPELERCEMIYRKWKLKEFSAVAVPGNSECLTMLVSRGMWTPPANFRGMTESQGLGPGGAAVKPAEEEEERADGCEGMDGKLCPKGECKRCDAMRAKKRSAPFVDTDGGSWWIDDNGARVLSFRDARLAEECLRLMTSTDTGSRRQTIEYEAAIILAEHQRMAAETQNQFKEYIELYRYGRV